MLKTRIIASLLINEGGLVKTKRLKAPIYLGDPINAVRIFNDKEIDELLVLDISSSDHLSTPNYSLLERLSAECRMPLCYGGRVSKLDQFKQLVSLGIEKVALCTAAYQSPSLITQAADMFGSQSVVASIEISKHKIRPGYSLTYGGGKKGIKETIKTYCQKLQGYGAGEILLHNIGLEDTFQGIDVQILETARSSTTLPLTMLGGASSFENLVEVGRTNPFVGLAAGSIFCLKGPYSSPFIQYLPKEYRTRLNSSTYEEN